MGEFAAGPLKSTVHRLAYLQVRMPATYAACHHVLEKTREVLPEFEPASLLDLGAGPGTASWAAVDVFPSLDSATLLERDAELASIGKALATDSDRIAIEKANWITANLRSFTPDPCDLIVLSFAVGELSSSDASRLILKCWQAAKVLVMVEPGTPKSFDRMATLRKELIAVGAKIAAPCPGEIECPMLAQKDWCHFAERVERTSAHRRLKGGSLGYEDEKFSYLAATRLPLTNRNARIVRHPQIHTGYVQLQLCATDALKQITVTKSRKEAYRAARKARWGDWWSS